MADPISSASCSPLKVDVPESSKTPSRVVMMGVSQDQLDRVQAKLQTFNRSIIANLVMRNRSTSQKGPSVDVRRTQPSEEAIYHFNMAYKADLKGDSAGFAKHSRWLAERGETNAQTMMEVPSMTTATEFPSSREADKWFRLAAAKGQATAQFMVGLRLLDGKAGRQDDIEAVRWLKLAMSNGEPHARKVLEIFYEQHPTFRPN